MPDSEFPFPTDDGAKPLPAYLEAPEPDRFMRRRKRAPMHLKINVTSLIDVTFLLLVYFMIATSFTSSEEAYRTDIPSREGLGSGDPFQIDDDPLRIEVNSTGLGPEMYRLRIDGPFPQPTSFDDLFTFLASRQVRADVTGGMFEPEHPIVIQPTRTTSWEHAMQAYNAAARAKYSNVTFAKPG